MYCSKELVSKVESFLSWTQDALMKYLCSSYVDQPFHALILITSL